MDGSVIYNVFLFIVIPLLLTLVFADPKSKLIFGFLILGISICLIASELNSIIMTEMGRDFFYYSTTISPILEEILKSIPLIFTIYFIFDKPDLHICISLGLAIGIGFAIFENIVIYFQSDYSQTLIWSFARGIGAGLMHGICGGAAGFGICFMRKYGRIHFFGLLSILTAIILYHGFYNLLVQSEQFAVFGVFLPVLSCAVFIPVNLVYRKKYRVK